MSTLSVSVVTPSFNQGAFIDETIQSVLSQGIDGLEYIVMDGGSTDQTLSILNNYSSQLKWVSEPDRGQSHAVNKGIQQSSGDIIGWLNSDDIYYPEAIKKVCAYFYAHPEVDVIYGDANQIDRDSRVIEPYQTETWDRERLKLRCFISQPATFFRRRMVEKYGLIDEERHYCMDYEYWLRLSLKGARIAYLPEVLAGARIYGETKSSRGYVEAHLDALNMLHRALGYIPAEWIVNYATAKTKTEQQLKLPHPGFVLHTCKNIWLATGLHYKGWQRFGVWLKAQGAMGKKLLKEVGLAH